MRQSPRSCCRWDQGRAGCPKPPRWWVLFVKGMRETTPIARAASFGSGGGSGGRAAPPRGARICLARPRVPPPPRGACVWSPRPAPAAVPCDPCPAARTVATHHPFVQLYYTDRRRRWAARGGRPAPAACLGLDGNAIDAMGTGGGLGWEGVGSDRAGDTAAPAPPARYAAAACTAAAASAPAGAAGSPPVPLPLPPPLLPPPAACAPRLLRRRPSR
jgi:hypothetical protein